MNYTSQTGSIMNLESKTVSEKSASSGTEFDRSSESAKQTAPLSLTAIWFSYKGDEDLLPFSIKAFKETFPAARLVVVDDCYVSCSGETAKTCKALGAEWRMSDWPRNGNLIGPEPLRGMMEIYHEYAPDTDFVCKIDCDTFVFSDNWVRRLSEDPEALIAAAVKRQQHYLFGMAYAIKSQVIRELYEDIRDIPCWTTALEDFEIGSRLFRISGKKLGYAHRYCVLTPVSRWALCPPDAIKGPVRKDYDVVSIGWVAPGRDREQLAQARKAALKHLFTTSN